MISGDDDDDIDIDDDDDDDVNSETDRNLVYAIVFNVTYELKKTVCFHPSLSQQVKTYHRNFVQYYVHVKQNYCPPPKKKKKKKKTTTTTKTKKILPPFYSLPQPQTQRHPQPQKAQSTENKIDIEHTDFLPKAQRCVIRHL